MPLLSNAKLKTFRSLKTKKYREREQKFLIEGIKLCGEAFNANTQIDAFLFCPQIAADEIISPFLKKCQSNSIPYFEIHQEMLKALSDTVHSQGIVCVIKMTMATFSATNASSVIAVAGVQEPGNLGTIIRTADWFGADAVLLGKGTVDVYNAKVLRSTMGSIFHIPAIATDLQTELAHLKQNGMTIYMTTAAGGQSLHAVKFAPRSVIVLGNESHGIDDSIMSLVDVNVSIPRFGQAESLNVAIANGIILNQMAGRNGVL